MIHIDEPSLSVCAFGAGAAHAAVLALVLPVLITLPAPDHAAQGTVAIQVIVRSTPPAFVQAAMLPQAVVEGEGDIDEAGWAVPEAEEITGALPDIPEHTTIAGEATLMEQAALSEPVEAALPVEAAAPVAAPEAALAEDAPAAAIEEDVELSTIASIEADEPDFMPYVVPRPLRKPGPTVVVEPQARPKPAPQPQVTQPRVTQSRPNPPAKPLFKGLLGGTRATPMAEFPFGAGR